MCQTDEKKKREKKSKKKRKKREKKGRKKTHTHLPPAHRPAGQSSNRPATARKGGRGAAHPAEHDPSHHDKTTRINTTSHLQQ